MNTNNYYVKFNVDGRPGGAIMVEARNPSEAKNFALAEIQGRPGYAGKRIYIAATIKR